MLPVCSIVLLAASTPTNELRLSTAGSCEDRARGRLLQLAPCASYETSLRGLDARLQLAGVLRREQALRDDDVEQHGEHQRRRARPAASAPGGRAPSRARGRSGRPRASKTRCTRAPTPRSASSLVARLQPARRHHRHQRQRHDRRDQDRDRQRHGELAEQAADDVAHEQQRDQHRDQRDRQRDDREADLRRALQRRLAAAARPPRRGARCSRSSRSRRRRRSRSRSSAPSGSGCSGCSRAGTSRRRCRSARSAPRGWRSPSRAGCEEREDHQHDQHDGEHQLDLDVLHRGADAGRAVGRARRRCSDAGRPACSVGSCALIASTVAITLAPGWRCTLRMIAGRSSPSAPRRRAASFSALSTTWATSARRTGAPFW